MSKQELWKAIKVREIVGVKWTNSKEIMIGALYAKDVDAEVVEDIVEDIVEDVVEDVEIEEVEVEEVEVEEVKVEEVIEEAEEPEVLTMEDIREEVVVFKPLPPKRKGSTLPRTSSTPPPKPKKDVNSKTVAPNLGTRLGGASGRRPMPGFVSGNPKTKDKKIRWG